MLRLKWLNPQGRDANTKPMHQRTDSINLAYQDTFIRKCRFTLLWASTILSINFFKYDNTSMKNMLSLPELWRWIVSDRDVNWFSNVMKKVGDRIHKDCFGFSILGFRLFVSFFLFVCLFYRSLVALQYWVNFCCTVKWISHTYTYIPSLSP